MLVNLLPIIVGDDKDIAGSNSKSRKRTMTQCQKMALTIIEGVAGTACLLGAPSSEPKQDESDNSEGIEKEDVVTTGTTTPVASASLAMQNAPLVSVVMLFLRQVCLKAPSKSDERTATITHLARIFSNENVTPEHRAEFITFLHKYCRNAKINFRTFGVDTASALFKQEGQSIGQGSPHYIHTAFYWPSSCEYMCTLSSCVQ
jgi:hypothetical protein